MACIFVIFSGADHEPAASVSKEPVDFGERRRAASALQKLRCLQKRFLEF